MFRKTKVFVAFVVAVAFIIGALPTNSVSRAQDTLKIGLLTDKSGALAIYGVELSNGFNLGLQYATNGTMEVGGRKIEVVERDNASDPNTGVSQAQELIETEGAEVLVGAPSSGVTVAVQQVAKDSDVVLFAAPGASPAITGANFNVNTFRVCRNTYQDSLSFVPYAKESGLTKFVILAADYEFGRASAAGFEAVFKAAGLEFVHETIFAPLETNDFTTYLQEVMDSGAQAVIPIWAGDTSVALFQQIAELGVKDKMSVIAAFNSNDIVKLSDPSNIGNVSWIVYHYSLPKNEINDWLVEEHKKAYDGDVPDLFTECAFATAQALVKALEGSSGDATPAALIPQLEGMTFDGPKGTYYIRPGDHQALVPMYIVQLDNLTDPDQKYYKLLKEVPALEIIPPCEAGEERCAMNEAFMESISK
ncbi:MAG: substrate-binding domain-containing protein [Anaerolineae bacterium]|nr:substrate-binding domain-containing protein [Anaerolineae bacterium]